MLCLSFRGRVGGSMQDIPGVCDLSTMLFMTVSSIAEFVLMVSVGCTLILWSTLLLGGLLVERAITVQCRRKFG